MKKQRRCGEAGYDNLPQPMPVDKYSGKYSFCPGKATWSLEAAELFTECRVALEAGILPLPGALEDQDEIFGAAFPGFIERWRERTYNRVWRDVAEFTNSVLKGIFGSKG